MVEETPKPWVDARGSQNEGDGGEEEEADRHESEAGFGRRQRGGKCTLPVRCVFDELVKEWLFRRKGKVGD